MMRARLTRRTLGGWGLGLAFGQLLPPRFAAAAQGPEDVLPKAQRRLQVASGEELRNALAAAKPGDEILLGDGTYAGEFRLRADGRPDAPIVLRAARRFGATLVDRITLAGRHGVLAELAFTGEGQPLLANDFCRLTRCRVTRPTRVAAIGIVRGRSCRVDHCEISDFVQRGINVDLDDPVEAPRIDHNYLHDQKRGGGNAGSAIGVGQTAVHNLKTPHAIVEYNLLENTAHSETIACKSSGNLVQFNTVLDGRTINNRHGKNNSYIANWIEDSHGLNLNDRGCMAIGNRLVNCKVGLRVSAGTDAPDDVGSGKANKFPFGEGCLFVDNEADELIVGYVAERWKDPMPARDTQIEGHRGRIVYGLETGTRVMDGTKRAVPQPVRLTRDQVGPDAA